jgi:hypothetical protein
VVMIASAAAFEWIETPANRWMRGKSSGIKNQSEIRRAEIPARSPAPGGYELAEQPVLS